MIRKNKIFLIVLLFMAITACAKKEDRALAFYDSGMQFFNQNDFDKARVELLNAIQMDPSMGEAYFQLGLIAQAEGDIPLMYENMSTAMFLDKQNVQAKLYVAEILLVNKQFDEVYEIAEAAYQIDDALKFPQLRFANAPRLSLLKSHRLLRNSVIEEVRDS